MLVKRPNHGHHTCPRLQDALKQRERSRKLIALAPYIPADWIEVTRNKVLSINRQKCLYIVVVVVAAHIADVR